jgi:aminoglycoside 6'-N-acetyltransferase I
MRMKIREVQPEDQAEWVRMRNVLWPDESEEHEAQTRWFFAQHDDRFATFVVERPGGGLGGFLEAGWRNYAEGCRTSPVAYIEGWYVDPDLRQQGAGRALVGAAEAWARARGFHEMASDAELGNDISIRAHGALGYEEVGRTVNFRKDLGNM